MSFTDADWDELMIQLEDNECLLVDGFDMALVGISVGANPVAVYDINKMRGVLVSRDEMSAEEAQEYLDYNVISAYVGEKTPLFIDLDFVRACAFSDAP